MRGKQTNNQNSDQSRRYAFPVTGKVFCMWRVHYTRESVTSTYKNISIIKAEKVQVIEISLLKINPIAYWGLLPIQYLLGSCI